MIIKSYKTHKVTSHDRLLDLIDKYVPQLPERSILTITSKIVSICEGRVVAKDSVESKEELVKKHADAYLKHGDISLTITNGVLIPTAGIDESNGNGYYILYPEDVQRSAEAIWLHLLKRDKLKELGVIITDSRSTPFRKGVTGFGLGYCGFNPLYSYIGHPDCFGKPLKATQSNCLDALAAAAVFCMGEGNEQTPFAVIDEAPSIRFQSLPPSEQEVKQLSINLEEDLYAPLLKR